MARSLLDRLSSELGFPLLDADGVDRFLAANGNSVLFFSGDPAQFPEANDVAVILPELMRVFGDRCRAAVVERGAQRQLQARFGFSAWPTLVLLRGDQYLGAISRVQDWPVYLEAFSRLLVAEPRRPPTVGVSVTAGGGTHVWPGSCTG